MVESGQDEEAGGVTGVAGSVLPFNQPVILSYLRGE
jgi:hypothetical protein